MKKINKNKYTFSIFIFLIACVLPFASQARHASDDEVGMKILKQKVEYRYDASGLLHKKYLVEMKILREKAMDTYSTYSLTYDANQDSIDRLEAWVVAPDGTKYPVDPANIVDKSLASNKPGFDENRTRYFPWPHLSVGAILHLEFDETLKPEMDNVISNRFELLPGYTIDEWEWVLIVPRSVSTKLTDNVGLFAKGKIESESAGLKTIKITAKNLPSITYKEEEDVIDPESLTAYIDITSTPTWVEANKVKSQGYDKVLAQPLPDSLLAIFGPKPDHNLSNEEAYERLNDIMNRLITNIRYFGDWRRVNGGYVPRDLAEIMRTGYADCKDYSVLVVAAARHLGLQASPAVIYRDLSLPQPPTLPMPFGWTNHAIAKVIAPDGKTIWWTDATNDRSPLGIIPADIAGRPALVLSEGGQIENLPEILPENNLYTIDRVYDLSPSPDAFQKITYKRSGYMGWVRYKQTYDLPPEALESKLLSGSGINGADVIDYKLNSSHFMTKFPFDWFADFSLRERNAIDRAGVYKIVPTIGTAYVQPILEINPENRFMDLDTDIPCIYKTKQILSAKTYSAVIAAPDACDIKSPWIDFKREIQSSADSDFEILSTTTIKTRRITTTEMKTPAFVKFQKDLADCVRNVKILVN